MPVSITHIIGTVALFVMLIAVGFTFSVISSQIEADMMRQQLGDIAGYVSANLDEMVWLVDTSNNPGVSMTKVIDLPESISGKVYYITLVQDRDIPARWYVEASVLNRPDVVARSAIPFNVAAGNVVLGANATALSGVIPSNPTYGGSFTYVVWAQRWANETGDWIHAGLGRLESRGA